MRTTLLITLLSLAAILVSACGATIFESHPLLVNSEDSPAAIVYFIRPELFKSKGIADNRLSINLDNQELLELSGGEYTLLKIKPEQSTVSTHSLSRYTNLVNPISVSRSREYKFESGKTYFIHIKQVNEEFRGVFYDPTPINLEQAQTLIANASPSGPARDAVIEKIDEDSIEAAKILDTSHPVLPEDMHPTQPYLLREPIKQ
jgi:hypothetical protein